MDRVTNSIETLSLLPPPTKDKTQCTSLADLPVEIQTQVYKHYYQPWTFYLQDRDYPCKHDLRSNRPPRALSLNFSNHNPSRNLVLTRRSIYVLANPFLQENFKGIVDATGLTCILCQDGPEWTDHSGRDPQRYFDLLDDLAAGSAALLKLLARATKLHIGLTQAWYFEYDPRKEIMPDITEVVFHDSFNVLLRPFSDTELEDIIKNEDKLSDLAGIIVAERIAEHMAWDEATWRRGYADVESMLCEARFTLSSQNQFYNWSPRGHFDQQTVFTVRWPLMLDTWDMDMPWIEAHPPRKPKVRIEMCSSLTLRDNDFRFYYDTKELSLSRNPITGWDWVHPDARW